MTEYTAFPLMQQLQDALTSDPLYCSGVLEVPPNSFELYYGRKEARFIDLLETSTSNDHGPLEGLARACEPAKFGRGEETVLDETYRKAGKMDTTNFKTGLDLESTRLLDTVRLGLVPGASEARTVRAELYKLNVYGEGAFFKPHKDTPRGQSMFGSLVVVFPTPHEGGALVLRHEDEEFTFDAAHLLSGRNSSIAYVAFFSDVEHEVMPVVSGHRVTLTYNLYYSSLRKPALPTNLEAIQPPHASAPAMTRVLSSLLGDPTFLPEGGMLGFGLRHDYPLPYAWTRNMEDPLDNLKEWLKGSDAVLFQACKKLGVRPLLRLVSEQTYVEIMLDHMVELGYEIENAEDELCRYRGGVVTRGLMFTGEADEPWSETSEGGWDDDDDDALTIHWITRWGFGKGPCSPYATYGNEASVEWLYMRVCLLVKIGPYGNRSEKGEDTEVEEGAGNTGDDEATRREADENDDEKEETHGEDEDEDSGNDTASDAQ